MTTGLFGDIAIVTWWRFTNVDRLYQAETLLQAINDYWSRISFKSAAALLSADAFQLLALWLRFELLYPLVVSGAVIALIALVLRHGSGPPRHQTIILSYSAAWLCRVRANRLRNDIEPISFVRYSSFTLPIVIAIGVNLMVGAQGARRTRAQARNEPAN